MRRARRGICPALSHPAGCKFRSPKSRLRAIEADLSDLSKSEREALKAIYRLTRDVVEAHTGDLAERLDVSPGTVTALVKRLAERGLAHYKPYKGVELTDAGRHAAVATI